MKSCMSAIRAYFEAKNKVWVTGDMEHMLRAGGTHSATWARDIGANFEAKSRSIRSRRSRLLRAHSKVAIHPFPGSEPKGIQRVQVDERVTWVYRDGGDYGVESRVIRHEQKWAYQNGAWVLLKDHESFEGQPVGAESAEVHGISSALPPLDMPKRQNCVAYDRVRALRYAELWWDGWNPAFPKLSDDCTNFISQCLLAGQMPMQGGNNRAAGWWYRHEGRAGSEPWSYSWTTSHALYIFLTSKAGATLLQDPKELKIGDVIFYDWDGSGRYHHTTMVVDFDSTGDPLVNAHTDASYHRHYLYLDSRAWTPRTRYAYIHIPDAIC